ncbi:MAG: glycosyltransferase [Candidatus Viridilinea halotolerans]|uniref:Glycosyltransferase n=1 Tax=Candidatus Viridilinea halotolerans TaxID=2491704 RepID=A0A426TX57_9CHLR|nr:MAG: glycosyltransferase [Candidatus Viridilinea halotolerans]
MPPKLLSALGATSALVLDYWRAWRTLRRRPYLAPPPPPSPGVPLVSILIPARNEERAIGSCVAAALAQDYPALEVLVVDDGSTDATPQILAQMRHHPQLRILSGRPLPPGWAGKPNVCQQLGEAAHGEWLLFLDADTLPHPQLTAALLHHAQQQQLALVSILPFLELGSFWERAILPAFQDLIMQIYPIERMQRPDAQPHEVLANGQCILVCRAAYKQIGGHAAVRAEVLEDVYLAQAVRRAGFRVGGGDGHDYLRVRMYTNGPEVVEGMAKHAAAGARAGGGRAWLVVARMLAHAFGPSLLVVAGRVIRNRGERTTGNTISALGAVAQSAGWCYWGRRYRELYAHHPIHALLWPLGLAAYLAIAVRAMWRVRRGHGVTWKGRRYAG